MVLQGVNWAVKCAVTARSARWLLGLIAQAKGARCGRDCQPRTAFVNRCESKPARLGLFLAPVEDTPRQHDCCEYAQHDYHEQRTQ